MSTPAVPSREEIDSELSLAIMGYDRTEKYPEWGNDAMREAYRAGFEDGRDAVARPIRELLEEWDAGGVLDYQRLQSLVYSDEELS